MLKVWKYGNLENILKSKTYLSWTMPKSKETDDHNQNSIGNGKLPFQKEVYFSKRKHYFFKQKVLFKKEIFYSKNTDSFQKSKVPFKKGKFLLKKENSF